VYAHVHTHTYIHTQFAKIFISVSLNINDVHSNYTYKDLNRCEKKMMAGIMKNMITGEIDMTRTTECYTVYKNMDI